MMRSTSRRSAWLQHMGILKPGGWMGGKWISMVYSIIWIKRGTRGQSDLSTQVFPISFLAKNWLMLTKKLVVSLPANHHPSASHSLSHFSSLPTRWRRRSTRRSPRHRPKSSTDPRPGARGPRPGGPVWGSPGSWRPGAEDGLGGLLWWG